MAENTGRQLTSLQVERFRVPEGTLIRLAGPIDERFPPIFSDAHGVVVVDFGGVNRVTSFGIRMWRQSVTTIQPTALYFVNVPGAVIAQFGMVAGFGGPKGQILTFQAPYRCTACGAEVQKLFDRRTESDQTVASPPTLPCPTCGGIMEFDDLPEYYQEALAGTAPLRIVPALFAVLAAGDAATRPLKIIKSVDDAATVIWMNGALDGRARFRHVADGLEGEVLLVPQVSACDDAGLRALSRLVDDIVGAGCQVWVARASLPMQEALARDPRALGPARVVSLESDATCDGCRRGAGHLATDSAGSGQGLYCPRCGNVCYPDNARALLALVSGMTTAPIPPWMPALLESRPGTTPTTVPGPFADKYALVRLVGAGGMAEVYLARQRGPAGFDRRVAIKRILPGLAREPSFIEMFVQEARLAARLSHPNIVQIHELVESEGQYYMVMEFVDGHDLSTLLNACRGQQRVMPVEVALLIVANMCTGLHAAHTARDESGKPLRIIHRDISPHNVLVGSDGSVKLSDFGIAKAADRLDQTRPGILKGKVSYLPPEAFTDAETDHRVDIFATGIVLFECLAGFHPFRRATDYQTTQALLHDPLPPLQSVRPGMPADIDVVLDRATARRREERYQSAEAMLVDLEQLLADLGRPAAARVVAAWVSSVKPATQIEATAPDKAADVTTGGGAGDTVTLRTAPTKG